ncbi:MAG: hypothetical protein ACP5PT_00825 [Brevinematia bacterium]
MKTINKLILILSLIFILSCASKNDVAKPLIMKCEIPDIPKADIEEINANMPYSVKLEKILNNCLKIKKENELLREAIKLCN